MSSGSASARVDQLAQAFRQGAGLRDGGPVPLGWRRFELDPLGLPLAVILPLAFLEGQQELRPGFLALAPPPGGQRSESLEQRLAHGVRRRQDLGSRAEVPAERQHSGAGRVLGSSALGAEHLEVGVPEPVDRLVLVADREQARVRAAEPVDQLELDAVRVLELVDHQVPEPVAPGRRNGFGRPQQLHRPQLQVREVEARSVRSSGPRSARRRPRGPAGGPRVRPARPSPRRPSAGSSPCDGSVRAIPPPAGSGEPCPGSAGVRGRPGRCR